MSEKFGIDMFTGQAAAQLWVVVCDFCGALVLEGEYEAHLAAVLHIRRGEE